LFRIDLVDHEIPYDSVMKRYFRPACFLFERTGEAMPRSPASLGVTGQYRIVINILNAVAHLQK